ncbi:uncharacterized protein LOC106172366 isoform X2 [Lingula anatina]|uniref:Uncharacterized protein LOC106172366 isoform X2 n=1 Tax=Lingula anatina TaxID=7574 RepID=A0A1S3JDJ4_LINAN|nr:uncharacterized protein LOC106172366 isoform X2 [Lingula anatina]|eukprot:XP_013408482.1 uncharacterized protein LOC106172366 isoform X2 [Lingula anatina]
MSNHRKRRAAALASGIDLLMECVDEELTPAQKKACRQAEEEYQNAMKEIKAAQANQSIVSELPAPATLNGTAGSKKSNQQNVPSDPDIIVLDDTPPRNLRTRSSSQTSAKQNAAKQTTKSPATPVQQPLQLAQSNLKSILNTAKTVQPMIIRGSPVNASQPGTYIISGANLSQLGVAPGQTIQLVYSQASGGSHGAGQPIYTKTRQCCCVVYCKSIGFGPTEDGRKITYHKFPKDKALRKQWLANIKREEGESFQIKAYTKVCSLHFKEEDFEYVVYCGRRYLLPGSVPTIFDCWKDITHSIPPRKPRTKKEALQFQEVSQIQSTPPSQTKASPRTSEVLNRLQSPPVVSSQQIVAGTFGLGIKHPAGYDDKKELVSRGRPREKDSKGNWVPLDEYYYSKKEGDPSYREEKGEFRFKCWYCHKMLYNNVKMMIHLKGHIDSEKQQNLDLADLTQCKHCYKQFDTPFDLQCHIEKVHQSNTSVLVCRICEKDHDSQGALTNHMRSHHVACEMPYICQLCNFRSSIFNDVVDHFKKRHDSSASVMCLYCLKVFKISMSKQNGWGLTQNFYQHLQKHQLRNTVKKCMSCKLTFLNKMDAKAHKMRDHLPNHKNILGTMSGKSSQSASSRNQVMIQVPNPASGAKGERTPKSLNAPAVAKSREFRSIRFRDIQDYMRCYECRDYMNRPDHYKKYVECSMCRFATCCSQSYASHMKAFHSGATNPALYISISVERKMGRRLYCQCGYSSTYGNSIANHLVFCSKRTSYVQKPETKFLELNDVDEESDYEPHEDEEEELVDVAKTKRKPEPASIFDALGLVKKQPCQQKVSKQIQEIQLVTDNKAVPSTEDICSEIMEDILDHVFPAQAAAEEFMSSLLENVDSNIFQCKDTSPDVAAPVAKSTDSEEIPPELTGKKKWETVKISDRNTPTRSSIFLGENEDDSKDSLEEETKDNMAAKENDEGVKVSQKDENDVADSATREQVEPDVEENNTNDSKSMAEENESKKVDIENESKECTVEIKAESDAEENNAGENKKCEEIHGENTSKPHSEKTAADLDVIDGEPGLLNTEEDMEVDDASQPQELEENEDAEMRSNLDVDNAPDTQTENTKALEDIDMTPVDVEMASESNSVDKESLQTCENSAIGGTADQDKLTGDLTADSEERSEAERAATVAEKDGNFPESQQESFDEVDTGTSGSIPESQQQSFDEVDAGTSQTSCEGTTVEEQDTNKITGSEDTGDKMNKDKGTVSIKLNAKDDASEQNDNKNADKSNQISMEAKEDPSGSKDSSGTSLGSSATRTDVPDQETTKDLYKKEDEQSPKKDQSAPGQEENDQEYTNKDNYCKREEELISPERRKGSLQSADRYRGNSGDKGSGDRGSSKSPGRGPEPHHYKDRYRDRDHYHDNRDYRHGNRNYGYHNNQGGYQGQYHQQNRGGGYRGGHYGNRGGYQQGHHGNYDRNRDFYGGHRGGHNRQQGWRDNRRGYY